MTIHGLLLAAGAGRRMGTPKALVEDWLVRGIRTLRDGGCDDVTVVLGAAADQARELLTQAPDQAPAQNPAQNPVRVVVAQDWAEGMGASLRAGLLFLSDAGSAAGAAAGAAAVAGEEAGEKTGEVAAMVSLVDLPDVGADVVRRVLAGTPAQLDAGRSGPTATRPLADVLRRAAYNGVPGHPVLLGRDHWLGIQDSARGDRGARAYLAERTVEVVECGDLATGRDVDTR